MDNELISIVLAHSIQTINLLFLQKVIGNSSPSNTQSLKVLH